MKTITFPYIYSGYRTCQTYRDCFASIWKWHNQTLNIWTMIFSFFLGTFLYTAKVNGHNFLPMTVYYLGQAVHNPLSVCYHTFMPVNLIFWRTIDINAIVFMNLCASWAVIYSVAYNMTYDIINSLVIATYGTMSCLLISLILILKKRNMSAHCFRTVV